LFDREQIEMNNLFERFLGRDRKSAARAKERLKLVLIHDRTDLSPAALEELKDELINVISKYVDIDPAAVRIDITHDGREQRLMADIPLRSVGRRRVK
jgi:cell division topological specificity factor